MAYMRSSCLDAQLFPDTNITNADMDGIAVAVTNVVVHSCLRILLTWSPTDITPGIQGCFLQFYPILLSALLSIKANRNQLSLYDARYALTLSSSPLTAYVVFASIGHLFGIKTGLYKRIKSHRRVVSFLGALVPFLWLGLSMTITLSHKAFKDSSLCYDSTFKTWLMNFLVSFESTIIDPGGQPPYTFVPVFAFPFFFLCRRLPQAWRDSRGRGRVWWRVWEFMKCTWRAMNHNHKWCIYLLFAYLDICWATQVIGSAAAASGKTYVLSYGQLLTAYNAIPLLILTSRFCYARRQDLWHLIQQFPTLCLAQIRYLIAGTEPYPPSQESPFPLTPREQPPTKRATI